MKLTKNGKRIGRPPEPVPQDLAESCLQWVASSRPLAEWCRQNDVSTDLVFDWREKDDTFRQRYARAREIGGEHIAERLRRLAAEPSDHPDDVAHRRLQVDVDKWLLARWFPSRYGDRQQVEHSGQMNLTVLTGVPDAPERLEDR
ncbi:MAG: hypothetical protein RL148_501 [Planctomycetota bacterium]